MLNDAPLGTILIVDDDANITDLLKFNLTSEGYGVVVVPNARDVNVYEIGDMRMVLVDCMSQPFTGNDLTREIKANEASAHVPVIICSSSDGEDDIIGAFDAGADDYVSKPFSLRELIARIKAILRRHVHRPTSNTHATPSNVISLSNINLQIDLLSQRVIEDGVVLPLTKTEYAILLFLIKHQNLFFSRDQICMEVWKDEAGNNARIVDTNISRLRKKLGENGKYIINRYGMGYAFVDKL